MLFNNMVMVLFPSLAASIAQIDYASVLKQKRVKNPSRISYPLKLTLILMLMKTFFHTNKK